MNPALSLTALWFEHRLVLSQVHGHRLTRVIVSTEARAHQIAPGTGLYIGFIMFSEFFSEAYYPLKAAGQPNGEFRLLTLSPGHNGSKINAHFNIFHCKSFPLQGAVIHTR